MFKLSATIYDLPLCLTATPHGLFTRLIVLIGVPRYFIMVTLMDFLWIPLHFDVQLVPPSTGGYIADFILAPLDIFHTTISDFSPDS